MKNGDGIEFKSPVRGSALYKEMLSDARPGQKKHTVTDAYPSLNSGQTQEAGCL